MFSPFKAPLTPLSHLLNHHTIARSICSQPVDYSQYPVSPLAYTGSVGNSNVSDKMAREQRMSSNNPFNLGGIL